MPMRIFYVPSNISIENLRHIFPPSTRMSLLPKCHLPHSLSQTTFFSRPAAHPLKIRKQNRLSNTKKKRNHTNATPKASKKKQFQHHRSQKSKANPSKRQSKTIHQTPPTRKYTHPNSHPNPTNNLPNPTQKPYTPKRKDVFPQTQVHFTPNAEEFAPKRFGVSSKTQGRLTTNASPFSAPKSPDNSPSCLQKRPKIPKNEKPLPPNSPKPLHFAPQPPPPEAF